MLEPGASDTKRRLLDAAERLFSSAGVAGTSLRAVTAEAGVNVAAVHYHFGSKDELLRAVFARRVAPINEERLKRLDRLEAGAEAPALEEVLDALVGPPLDFAARHPDLGDLSVLLYSEPAQEAQLLVQEVFGETTRRFLAALLRCLPALEPARVEMRLAFSIGAMLQVVSGRTPLAVPPAQARRDLVGFLAGGMRAGAPPPAPARRRT